MNISLQNVDNVSAVLTVQIEKADYQEKVEKALKTLRQRVNMPGFRKGSTELLYCWKKLTNCCRKK